MPNEERASAGGTPRSQTPPRNGLDTRRVPPKNPDVMNVEFTLFAGADVGKRFSLSPGGRVKIGRSREADVVLADPTVSRFHAEIFLARELETGRKVALKVIQLTGAAGREALAMFRREARTTGRLRHQNVVEIYDIGVSGRFQYIEMEYVPGRDILSILRKEGPFSVRKAVDVAVQVAGVLVAAGEKAIVHRDIKPANLILAESGTVNLCDFGIAKELDRAGLVPMTRSGTARGTIDYMAPEQFTDPESVGPKSDQYSLGATLYHMLSGKPRLSGGCSFNEYMKRIVSEEPGRVSSEAPGIPETLDDAVSRMLHIDPAKRFERASDVLQVLKSL